MEFPLLAAAAAVATVMDVESTVRAQRDPEAVEVNSWVYGERPTRSRMYGVNLPLAAGLTYLAYRLKTRSAAGSNAWGWKTPLLLLSAGHAAAAVANLVNFPCAGKESR